jgi:uncharacterized protein (TIGR02266 family)
MVSATSEGSGLSFNVADIDRGVGVSRSRLERMMAERNSEQEQLAGLRAEQVRIAERIRDLNQSITRKNRAIFMLKPELERLLALQRQVRERAQQEVLSLKAQPEASMGADTGAPADAGGDANTDADAGEGVVARADADANADIDASVESDARADAEVSADERRRHTRKPARVDVTMVSESNFYLGFSQDVSEGGLFIATYDGLRPVGERFPLVFTLPGAEEPIFSLVEVAWVREYREDQDFDHGSPGMGVRFIGLLAEDREAIAEFVENREPLFHPEADELSAS